MWKESDTLEFKREPTENIGKSVVAFANHNGGTIMIGVSDDGTVSGLTDPDKAALQVMNAVRDGVKPDVTLFVQVKTKEVEGKTILLVEVARGASRPYWLVGKGLRPEGVFVRQGAASVPASEALIKKMIVESDGLEYERMRAMEQDLTFSAATRFFKQRQVPFTVKHHVSLGMTDQHAIFTNLAMLLSDQCKHSIKAAVFEGTTKSIFRTRREFEGSLLTQLEDVHSFLEQYNRLHAEIRGLYRVDRRDYPEEALREVLLNCLVHRDYSLGGSTLISVFDDRMEFLSNGGLVGGITLEDILNGMSLSRNERLAAVFYRLQLVEAYGTGVEKLMSAYADHPQKPAFHVTAHSFRIVLPNRNAISGNEGVLSVTEPTYDANVAGKSGSPREEMKRVWMEPREIVKREAFRVGYLSRLQVQALLGVSQTMAGRVLREMVEEGILERRGKGARTVYLPVE